MFLTASGLRDGTAAVAITPDGTTAVVEVHGVLWETEMGIFDRGLVASHGMVVSADGRLVALARNDHVALADVETGEAERRAAVTGRNCPADHFIGAGITGPRRAP